MVTNAPVESKERYEAAPNIYKRGRGDYAAIRDLASDPSQIAADVGEEEYSEMLGCVPPVYLPGVPGFLVGEAITGDERGTVYANYFQSRDGLFCARYYCAPHAD